MKDKRNNYQYALMLLLLMFTITLYGEGSLTDGVKLTRGTLLYKSDFTKVDYSQYKKRKTAAVLNLANTQMKYKANSFNNIMKGSKNITLAIESKRNQILKGLDGNFPEMPILISDSSGLNASASEYGDITLSLGLLSNTYYEDEFIFALAHEISHILIDHFSAQATRRHLRDGLADATRILKQINTTSTIKLSDKTKSALKKSETAEVLVFPAWERGDEIEADKLAIDLMVRTGYSYLGGVEFLERLMSFEEAFQERNKKACLVSLVSIENLQQFSTVNFDPLSSLKNIFKNNKSKCNVLEDAYSAITKPHPDTKKRIKKLNAYIEKYYGDRGIIPMREFKGGNMLTFASSGGPVLRSIKANESIRAYYEDDFTSARRLAKESLDDKDVQTPKPRIANYLILRHDGKTQQALKHLDIVISSGNATRVIYEIRIFNYQEAQQYTEAIGLLREFGSRFGETEEIKPELITLYSLKGDRDKAMEVYKSCRYKKKQKKKQPHLKVNSKRCKTAAIDRGLIKKKKSLFGKLF